jgi:gliding motility-associated-like protein
MSWTGKIIPVIFCLITAVKGLSQPCTTLGQTPASAFPVCATTDFEQKTVPLCNGGTVPAKNCPQSSYGVQNPFWYKFTCFIAGRLGFTITPLNPQNVEDYDWQLFDVTGRNPMDIFTDASMIVTANWAGTYGPTGASAAGVSPWGCSSDPRENKPTFATMPELIQGHEYLLLVSHFLSPGFTSEIGYKLSFQSSMNGSGGLASITDPNTPAVRNVYGVCDGTEMTVKLNKKVKCNSLAADGSDFSISGPVPNSIISAVGKGCSTSFDMDTVRLLLSSPMVLGTYNVATKIGSDGNTLVDNCGNLLPVAQQTSTIFTPAQPTPMDSITPPVCIKDSVQLVFRKPMLCSSIAPDGSDFTISGPVPVTVKTARGVCSDGVSTYVNVLFTAPIRVNGNFIIRLKNGTDGNTLIDECMEQTPAGSTLPFVTKNITVADFQPNVSPGCRFDTLRLLHDGNGNANKWQWVIDTVSISATQNHTLVSRAFGTYTAQLTVTNGICSDAVSRTFILPDFTVKAAFSVADTLCPTDALTFTDQSSSGASSWRWNFGNGTIGTSKVALPQRYPLTGRISQYTVSLEVSNSLNCTDITHKMITVLASCYLAVPSAFTPNGDGLNDYFHPLNAFKADDMVFRVFNRFGQVVFESKDWTKKWDGRFKGLQQSAGTYVWTFTYTDRDSGEKVSLKGTTVLIR